MVKEEASVKKKVIGLILAVVVLVALIVAVFLVLKIQKQDSSSSEVSSQVQEISVLTINEESIKEINVINNEDSYTLKRKNDTTFVFLGKENTALDESKVNFFITQLSSIKAVVSANKMPESLANYGLTKPSTTLKILLNDGKVLELLIGDITPKGDSFVKTDASNEVFVVQKYTVEELTSKKLSFYNMNLPSGLTVENLNFLKIQRANADTISIVKNEQPVSSELALSGSIGLFLDKPISSELDSYAFNDEILNKLISLSMIGTVTDDFSNKNKVKYGLDVPKYTLNYSFEDNEITLFIGDKKIDDNTENYFCIIKGTELIYLLPKANAPFLDITVGKIANKLQYITNIKEVNSIKIEGQGKNYEFLLINSEGDNMQIKYNNKELVAEDFRTLYQTIIGISQTDYISDKPKSSAEITITFTLKNGKVDVLKFIPYDYLSYYYSINGVDNFIVKRDSVTKVLTNAQKYINGEKITV